MDGAGIITTPSTTLAFAMYQQLAQIGVIRHRCWMVVATGEVPMRLSPFSFVRIDDGARWVLAPFVVRRTERRFVSSTHSH